MLTDTRVCIFFFTLKIFIPFGDLGGSIHCTSHKTSHGVISYYPFFSWNTRRDTNQTTYLLKTVSKKALRGTVSERTKWTCRFHAEEQSYNLMNALSRHQTPPVRTSGHPCKLGCNRNHGCGTWFGKLVTTICTKPMEIFARSLLTSVTYSSGKYNFFTATNFQMWVLSNLSPQYRLADPFHQ